MFKSGSEGTDLIVQRFFTCHFYLFQLTFPIIPLHT